MKKLIPLLLALAMFGGACTYANTSPDEFACAYGGGPFEAQVQKEQLAPGSGRDFIGVADTVIELPANVRNYIVDKDPGSGDVPDIDLISTPSSDGVEMEFEASVRFRINSDLGCKLWEEHGKRFGIDTDEGWQNFLEQNLRPILERTMKEQSQQYQWEDSWRNSLTDDGQTWTLMQDAMGQSIVTEINRSLGDDYLCGITWKPGQESCPPFEVLLKSAVPEKDSLTDRYADVQLQEAETERQRVEKARELEEVELEARNNLAEVEAQIAVSEKELEKARLDAQADAQQCIELAAAGVDCTLLEAARNGSIEFWVVDGDNGPTITRQAN